MIMKKIYPNIYGKGTLFAYSGLDGTNTLEGSMCGQLLGERVGMRFDADAVELYMRFKNVYNFSFSIVASDIILGKLNEQYDFGYLFIEQNIVLGFGPKELVRICCHGDFCSKQEIDNNLAFEKEGNFYVLAVCERGECVLFSICREKDIKTANDKAINALDTNINHIIEKKLAFYDNIPDDLDHLSNQEKMTLAKCFSVMKSQVYTSEGKFKQRWTTPDRLPHRMLWLWDSVFHSIGNVYIEPQLAYDSIRSVLDTQSDDGFIPHMALPNDMSDITQPPIIAWGIYKLYENTGNEKWLEESYEQLKKYLIWNLKNRDSNKNYLFEWAVDIGQTHCRCAESGMDNSPRFDNVTPMDAIDFSCYMANEARSMKKISEVLEKTEDTVYFEKLFYSIRNSINTVLFDSEDGRYYDREIESGNFRKVSAVSSFLPLFAGVCTVETAGRLVQDMYDENTFGTVFGVPSISIQDDTFGEDMWRGPVWINYNYMIICGLKEYGYEKEAKELTERTISVLTEWYMKEGTLFEFYDCNNEVSPLELSRKGPALKPYDENVRTLSIKDYGWTCTLYVALIMEREKERLERKI